ncbi:MAG TPA: MlaD family protein [Armatimonadota bacterium]|nr:MlaD family protein [Armatimonadota bacterium]
MKSGAEVKVGLVVVAALVVLALILYYFIGLYAARAGYPLDVLFERAEVRAGDGVTMAGVTVGQVESVGLTPGNRALVRLRIRDGVVVRWGYDIRVAPGVLLGEKSVEITPVSDERAGAPLEPGAQVKGESSLRVEDLLADAQRLVGRLTEAVESVTALVQNREMRLLVEQSLASLGRAARDMGDLARTLGGMAQETRPRVQATLANVEGVTRDLRETSQAVARAATESEVPAELEETARRLRSVVERVDDIAAQFQELAADPEMKDFAKDAARSLRDSSDRIREAATVIAEGARQVPDIMSNARAASENIRDASAEIKEITHEARTGLSQVTGRAAEAAKAIGELPPVRADLNAGAQYLTRDGRWWVDANVDLSSRDRLVRLGAADLGETNRLNFQMGQGLGPGRLRYGLVESEIGLGYDWPVTPWLTLSAEVFDPNDLRANVFGRWGLGGSLDGWSAITGYRKVGGDGSPAIGIRAER